MSFNQHIHYLWSPVEIMWIVLCRDISRVLWTREISLHKTIHMSFGLVKYHYTKQFTWSSQGIPHSPVLVFMPYYWCYKLLWYIASTTCSPPEIKVWRSRSKQAIVQHNTIVSVNYIFKTHSTLSMSSHDIFKLHCFHKRV